MNDKTKNITGWIVTGLLGLAFLMAGMVKISGQDEMIQNFDKWGFPVAFMYFIGISELLGAIGLFVKITRIYAAFGLIAVMLGAIGTHIVAGENFFVPLILLILVGVLVFIRKEEIPFLTKKEIA